LKKDYKQLLNGFKPKTLRRIGIRFGLAKNIIGEKPFFRKEDYPQLGKKIIDLVQFFQKSGLKEIFLDCGLKKEMFNWGKRLYLYKKAHLRGWDCEGKWSSFDIAYDLDIFPCFPYYKKIRKELCNFENFRKIEKCFEEKEKCYP
jgi:hypothetical protein